LFTLAVELETESCRNCNDFYKSEADYHDDKTIDLKEVNPMDREALILLIWSVEGISAATPFFPSIVSCRQTDVSRRVLNPKFRQITAVPAFAAQNTLPQVKIHAGYARNLGVDHPVNGTS